MASLQKMKSHEERAQAAAEKAADELAAARRDRQEAAPVKDAFSGSGGRGDTAAAHDSGTAGEGKAKAGGMAEKARDAMGEAADRARCVRDAAADRDEGACREKAAGGAESEEDVTLRVKAADHMTGQAFNDVGPIGEEGTGMPRRRR